MSSPAADGVVTTPPVLEGLPDVEAEESMGLPEVNSEEQFISSGLDIAPMGSLVETVNGHLKDCEWCKGTPLVLELNKHVVFSSNWKLSCSSCDEEEKSIRNLIDYLETKADTCGDHKQRRSIKKIIYKKDQLKVVRKRKKERMISSPVTLTSPDKPTIA